LSLGTIIAILIGMLPLQSTEKPASRVANALWIALIRNNWGYSIAWIIFACQNGSGGIIKWFLELPCWQPLGRMSLSFYLVHSIYITVEVASNKTPLHFNMTNLVNMKASQS
jgi:peptidoglycan/LPS O-acetylase OafA/YrhL